MCMKVMDHHVINIPIRCITVVFFLNDGRVVGAKRNSIRKKDMTKIFGTIWRHLTSVC